MPVDLNKLLREALTRQLEELRDQVKSLAEPLDEKRFWTKPLQPGNSFGHLVLHLTGNLNHFAGAQIGNTGYVRDREREFTESSPPAKAVALAGLDDAVTTFRRVVEKLSPDQLAAPHPTERMGTTVNALLQLVTHFALHRGQLSYISRLASGDTKRE